MTVDGILLPSEENLSYSPLFVRVSPLAAANRRNMTHETYVSVIPGQI